MGHLEKFCISIMNSLNKEFNLKERPLGALALFSVNKLMSKGITREHWGTYPLDSGSSFVLERKESTSEIFGVPRCCVSDP